MSKLDPFKAVLEFMAGPDRGRNIGTTVGFPKDDVKLELRMNLIREEMQELEEAVAVGDFVEALDAIADLLYVVIGFGPTCGVDLRPIFEEVHRTNMQKYGAPDRADGKILKGPDWQPPNIEAAIRPIYPPVYYGHVAEAEGGRK